MSKQGRKTKFSESLAARILDLASQGLTEDEIAASVGLCRATLSNWKGKYKGFLDALNASKDIADGLVEASLFARATGYSHPAVKIMCSEGQILTEAYTEHYPPDTTACIFWLKNRQKKRWRDSKEIQFTKEQAIKVLEDELKREGISDSSASQEPLLLAEPEESI